MPQSGHAGAQPLQIHSKKTLDAPMIGRFAPSPTGPLHAGSLVAAMASWLDVRAHHGRWIVRLEDIDCPREVAGAADAIVHALDACGFRPDAPIARQSTRAALYEDAFRRLRDGAQVYPCGCSRREIDTAVGGPDEATRAVVYPGTCRHGLPEGRVARAWRMRVAPGPQRFDDRAAGPVTQDLAEEVGDFVIRRADGLWAYQLAVVVDDADQGITDVVRGADLLDSTPRQRWLQTALGFPRPRTLHVPVVVDRSGAKLSKSTGAAPVDAARPLDSLLDAARHLHLDVQSAPTIAVFWERATAAWAARWRLPDG